ncbi:MAG: hypothetical protein ACK47B_22115 [Armatimonadota bacterium]
MTRKPRLGEYRHIPDGGAAPGAARNRPTRKRRRFPYVGIVLVVNGLLGTLTLAGLSLLIRALGLTAYLPQRIDKQPSPPAPSLDNVIFNLGLPETILLCALIGGFVWRFVWNVRLPDDVQQQGPRATLGPLLQAGVTYGLIAGILALPLGSYAHFLRAAPADIPWAVRPFFGVLDTLVRVPSALMTNIPLVALGLGLLLGLVTAPIVALLWPHFPEEPLWK